MKHKEFPEIPSRLVRYVNRVFADNLLIQAGRTNELQPLGRIDLLAVRAYQKAENTVTDEIHEERRQS